MWGDPQNPLVYPHSQTWRHVLKWGDPQNLGNWLFQYQTGVHVCDEISFFVTDW